LTGDRRTGSDFSWSGSFCERRRFFGIGVPEKGGGGKTCLKPKKEERVLGDLLKGGTALSSSVYLVLEERVYQRR